MVTFNTGTNLEIMKPNKNVVWLDLWYKIYVLNGFSGYPQYMVMTAFSRNLYIHLLRCYLQSQVFNKDSPWETWLFMTVFQYLQL